MNWIAVTGNITDGHSHFGPFDSLKAARVWGARFKGQTYVIYLPLDPPTDEAYDTESERIADLGR